MGDHYMKRKRDRARGGAFRRGRIGRGRRVTKIRRELADTMFVGDDSDERKLMRGSEGVEILIDVPVTTFVGTSCHELHFCMSSAEKYIDNLIINNFSPFQVHCVFNKDIMKVYASTPPYYSHGKAPAHHLHHHFPRLSFLHPSPTALLQDKTVDIRLPLSSEALSKPSPTLSDRLVVILSSSAPATSSLFIILIISEVTSRGRKITVDLLKGGEIGQCSRLSTQQSQRMSLKYQQHSYPSIQEDQGLTTGSTRPYH
eukprot:scaffold9515_cov136-Skeletonema_dohrnii-CCMP3373.AAC.3